MTEAVASEGQVDLAYEARAVPEAPRDQAPLLGGDQGIWKQGCHPPSPRGPGPNCFIHCQAWRQYQGQQAAALRAAISHVGPHFPGPTLAGPSPGPMRRGLALAILQHGQVPPLPRCSWPAPWRWPLGKVNAQNILLMGAGVEGRLELRTDGAHACCG